MGTSRRSCPRTGSTCWNSAIRDSQATGRAIYRLLVGAVPFAGEVYPLAMPRGQNTALELRGGTLSGDRLFALRAPSDPLLAMFSPTIPARLLGDPAWADSELDVELPTPVLLGTAAAVDRAGRSGAEACRRSRPR